VRGDLPDLAGLDELGRLKVLRARILGARRAGKSGNKSGAGRGESES
jgi:hypothetical protein